MRNPPEPPRATSPKTPPSTATALAEQHAESQEPQPSQTVVVVRCKTKMPQSSATSTAQERSTQHTEARTTIDFAIRPRASVQTIDPALMRLVVGWQLSSAAIPNTTVGETRAGKKSPARYASASKRPRPNDGQRIASSVKRRSLNQLSEAEPKRWRSEPQQASSLSGSICESSMSPVGEVASMRMHSPQV